ncbi:hypothetical protein [Streptomyces marianii]|uniref:Uncharacterized protein n=1 Tax=Streptomyces marianii TaxID=1817406 RepID=A0A5R9E344_9ACTN|nr:hypothetical protein [Streptomyces marianii]TLQ43362.1 hypothetical protein FEF34_09615 [Streptomyces marianii]
MDELLTSLAESPAEHKKIGEQKVTTDSYGTGFSAATDLHAAYEKVRARLEGLSRTFGETIEALGIRVEIAEKGYAGVDQEERDRFAEIQKRTEDFYKPDTAQDGAGKDAAKPKQPADTGDSGGFS